MRMSRTLPATGDPVLLWPAFAPESKTSSRGGIVEETHPFPKAKATDNCATPPVWPACWIDTPDRSPSSVSKAVQDAWDINREKLEVVPQELVLMLRSAYDRAWC